MALDSYHHSCFVLPPPLPDLGWDWDWELVDDAARELKGIHDAFTAMPSLGLESPVSSSSEASSGGGGGYLEDAVAHWSGRCKRQRTAAAAEEEELPPRWPAMASEDLQCLLQSFWDSSSGEGDLLLHGSNTMAPHPEQTSSFASEQGHDDASSGREKEQGVAAAGQADEAGPTPPPLPFSATGAGPSSPLQQRLQKATTGRGSHYCEDSSSSSLLLAGKSDGTGTTAGVLYPFAVVKPLRLDGGTLSDVNRRILKRPARPVRHPVGQFACGPVVSSPHGPGLSGKAVVSLTKIRTGGKGTITVIRTRG